MRTIYLPAIGQSVTIGQYVKAVNFAKANPDHEFKHGFTCWWPCTGREIIRQFLDGVHERINEGIPYIKRGAY